MVVISGVSCATSAARRRAAQEERSAEVRTALRELGRLLFTDVRLSRDSTLSCATCHSPDHGFAESRAESRGIGENSPRRNAQSLLDVGRRRLLTWDGRLRSLEEQVREAFTEDGDMGVSLAQASERLSADTLYTSLFRHANART